jgi:hypothetical protein
MLLRVTADLVVLLHVAFVVFVVSGGLLVLKWPRAAYLHLPAAAWGALIEFAGWVCPLTPLENHLRRLAGEAGYSGGFVEHYVVDVLYPAGWTLALRITLGVVVVAANLLVYSVVLRRRSDRR